MEFSLGGQAAVYLFAPQPIDKSEEKEVEKE